MALPELTGWEAESVRMTCMASVPITASGKNWWQAFTGSAPEAVVSKPGAAMHSESGPFGAGRLEMKVTFNRVDWLYTPIIEPGPAIPSLGTAEEFLASMSEPLGRWLSSSGDVPFVRIASGATLLRPVPDIAGGNLAVLAYLPFVQLNAEVARDIFFQTNFPRQSKVVDGITLNRISRFMSAAAQVINIQSGSPIPTVDTQYLCRVELDFSTNADRQEPIPTASRSALYEELVASVREMMTLGVQE